MKKSTSHRGLNAERDRQIRRLLRDGESAKNVAAMFGLSLGRVYTINSWSEEKRQAFNLAQRARYHSLYGIDMEYTEKRREKGRLWYAKTKREAASRGVDE